MPFWLCENRLFSLLRTISLQKQILITLCCMLGTAGCTVLFKQTTSATNINTNKHLKNFISPASSKTTQRLTPTHRASLALEAIPQTIGFFATAGFHVRTAERLLRQRNNHTAGYIVNVHGSFDVLMNFLDCKKHVPATQLYLQSLSRIDDTVVEVEFFIPKHQI